MFGIPLVRRLRIVATTLLGLVAASSGVVWALDPLKLLEQYPIDQWSTDDGLPQASVQALLQSRDGFLWLGTQEGLVRFDGVSFAAFSSHNTPSFANNMVRALIQDRSGTIWIGTDGGLVRLHNGVWSSLTTADGLVHDAVNVLLEDANGSIWVGTDNGLSRIVDGSITCYTTADGLPHGNVRGLAEDTAGRLWVGTGGGGVVVLDGSLATTVTVADGLADDEVLEVFIDSRDRIWFGTRNGLTCRHAGGRFETFTIEAGLPHVTVWEVIEDSRSRIWVGTSGGLSRLEGDRFSSLTREQGLSYEIVQSLLDDREGSLWIGTSSGGLNRLRDGKLVTYTRREGLTTDFVWTVLEDRQGAMWFGTDGGGLNRLGPDGTFSALTRQHGLLDNEVTALLEDRAGTLWVGTRAGLNRIRDLRVLTEAEAGLRLRHDILAVFEDDDGALWVGTRGDGLFRCEAGTTATETLTCTSFTTADGLPANNVRCIASDSRGNLWIGTGGGGVTRFEQGCFRTFSTGDGLPGAWVLAIHEDRWGILWFGTNHGLARLGDDGKLTAYTTAQGLHDNMVYQILEDHNGFLWMTCNRGVFRVARSELEELAHGKRTRVTSLAYGKADGMASSECNGGSQPAGWQARDGRLWFPTVAGAAVIDPHEIPTNQITPPVSIERLIVDGEEIGLQEPCICPAGSRRFEIAFSALSFIAPRRMRVQFRLEPYDKDWVEVVGRRLAHYTHIPPGRYRFQVRAANSDGVWSQQPEELELRVTPYFYQTIWFAAACVLVAVALVWIAYSLRMRQVRGSFTAVLAERKRMAREIHDTLAQGLTAISLQLEGLDETMGTDEQAARYHLERARQVIRTSLADARRTVWNLRSQVLEGSNLGEALGQIADQLTAGTDINTSVAVDGVRLGLSKEAEGQLLRIGQEAITNAVRHAACTSIRIRLEFEPGAVTLRVADNGRGFEQLLAKDGSRFGLRGMHERAAAVGGTLRVESQPGRGTMIVVVVPTDEMIGADQPALPFAPLEAGSRGAVS